MRGWKRACLIIVPLVTCVGCDRVTKDLAQRHLAMQPPLSWFHNTVRLEYAENTGAFLSIGGGLSPGARALLFQAFPSLFLCGLFLFIWRAREESVVWVLALCLMLSGGVGNLWDRFVHDGRVIDFMNLGIGPLRTGIFNVADLCITTGVVFLIIQAFSSGNQNVMKT